MTETNRKNVAGLLLSSTFIASLACGLSLSGTSCSSFGPCDSCPLGKENYTCNINGTKYYDCKGSQDFADLWCSGVDPAGVASPSNCGNAGLDTGETTWGTEPWDPGSHINYNAITQEYEIDKDFVAALKDDGFAPLSLDSARLVLSGATGYSGYYELDNVASGDLAEKLGLQDGDIIVSVNNYDLNTLDEQLDAYETLKTETNLTLKISRSSTLVEIDYVIIPD